MNHRSLRFRLTAWHSGLLAVMLVLFGAFVHFTLRHFLERNLREALDDEARTIGETLVRNVDQSGDAYVVNEIEEHFAPGITGRFVRVTRADGSLLYESSRPRNGGFEPSQIGHTGIDPAQAWREVHTAGGSELLIRSLPFSARDGRRYLIEAGAPYGEVGRVLSGLSVSLAITFPLILAVAIGGGHLLTRRALQPLVDMATTAERITSRSLNERVPSVAGGDELQALAASLNRMMERLEEAFRGAQRFSADASHEIRTPLAIVRGELEAAVQAPGIATETRERIGSALEETERLSRIVEQLLAMSRLDAGEALADATCVDLAELTRTTVEQMQLLGNEKSVELTCRAHSAVPVRGDRGRLKQVIVNLVDNALNYTPAGGVVSIAVSAVDGRAVLEVSDTGIGIPPDALPQIFDRFYRADKARSRQLGGAGLGLAIVKSICVAHGGTVRATNGEGRGAVFRVELPVDAPAVAV